MFRKKQFTIGLDIGSSYLKAVQLRSSGNGYELSKFDMLPLKPGIIADGAIVDKKALTDFLIEFVKKANIPKGQAVIGLSGESSLIIKRIILPLMTQDELSLSIKYEAQQYIPLDLDAVVIDFHIIGKTPTADNQMEVLLVAVNKALLNDYIEVIQNSGLELVVVDANQFALSNMFEVNYGISDERNIALVNVGASTTLLNIMQKGSPIFWRESSVGSNYHTEVLESTFNISREDAERLKKGFPIEGIEADDAKSLINKASDEIYAEIYRSLEVFRSNFYNEEVNKVYLSGGGALIKDFSSLMAQRIDMQVEIADPFKKIFIPDKINPSYIKEIGPIASIAVGLALRQAGDSE